jgi:hypothetical protein
MNPDNPMPKTTHENPNLPSAPPPGSVISLKAWKIEEASRRGIRYTALENRLARGSVPYPKVQRVNKRVILVLDPIPHCKFCGKPATCIGRDSDSIGPDEYACDDCCGHGNEDGHCHTISPNVRPEWRGGEGLRMQTGRAIPRPLQAACSAFVS